MAVVYCDCGCGEAVERKVYAGVACRVRMLRKRYRHEESNPSVTGNEGVTEEEA